MSVDKRKQPIMLQWRGFTILERSREHVEIPSKSVIDGPVVFSNPGSTS